MCVCVCVCEEQTLGKKDSRRACVHVKNRLDSRRGGCVHLRDDVDKNLND